MLAQLSLTARLPEIKFGVGRVLGMSQSGVQIEEELTFIDMDVLRWMPDFAWRRAVDVVEQIKPVCRSIASMLNEDAEHVAQVLYELEQDETASSSATLIESTQACFVSPSNGEKTSAPIPERRRRKRRRSHSPVDQQRLIIQTNFPSIPSIIVTPCLPPLEEVSCRSRIPFQDNCFGDRLTVPVHPVYNKVHPPLLLKTPFPLTGLGRWKWEGGHWQTVLPTVEEQTRKGLYSRPLTVRPRACRSMKEA